VNLDEGAKITKIELACSKIDELVKNQKAPFIVIPVKTEIQENQSRRGGRLSL